MKKMFIIIFSIALSLVVLILVYIASLPLLRVPICRGKIFKFARSHVQLFCPPKDLYKFILNEQIDIAKIDNIQTFSFKLKYIGPYRVVIVLDGFSGKLYREGYDLKLRVKLDFYKDDVLLISKIPTDNYDKFWALKEGKIDCDFNSPEDIPIDTEVTCKVTILATDEYLRSQCTGARLCMSRRSEE